MIDSFGRAISYLRLSVTDRCDMRCVYCMSEKMMFSPSSELLTLDEMERLCDVFISMGVRKIRLTGGEPLVRAGILDLVRALGDRVKAGALQEVTLTTNGTQLGKYAVDLAAAGVRRINVSLDSLRGDRFRAITRRGDLEVVLAGIEAARHAGLLVKINMVALRGSNDDEFVDLVTWCGARGFDCTFIETMPLGDVQGDRTVSYMPLSEVRSRLEARYTLTDIAERTGGPARYTRVQETGQKVGFITPISHNFCESCNRVRVTCTGTLFMCLGQNDAVDLRAPLRASESSNATRTAIEEAIRRKPMGHDFVIERRIAPPPVRRHMNVTGG